MNILVLAENINYNRTSSGIRSFNFLNLLKLKNNVTCICLEKYTETADVILDEIEIITLSNKVKLNPILEFLNKVPKLSGVLGHITGFNMFNYRLMKTWNICVKNALSKKKYDLIFVLGTGHDFTAHHAVARLKTNIPVVAHIHDPYPFNQYPEPYKQEKYQYKLLARQFSKVIKKASYVSFPSIKLKDWMMSYYPAIKDKQLILPHPASLINPDDFNLELPKELELQETFSLVHLGSLLGERNPIHLLKAYKKFCDSSDEKKLKSRLYIIGRINQGHEELLNNWEDFNNVSTLNTRISYVQSKKIMKLASGLIILEAVAKFSPFMPGKISDYIIANKPILALTPNDSEVTRILGDNYLYKSEVDNEENILKVLNLLWSEWKNEPNLSLNRTDLKEYISVEKTLATFDNVMQ